MARFTISLLFLAILWCCQSRPDGDQIHLQLDSLIQKTVAQSSELSFDESFEIFNTAYEIATRRGDVRNQLLATINIGVLYLKYNVQEDALRYFLQALELAKDNNREDFLNTIYNNIGVLHSQNDHIDKALEYYQLAYEISVKRNDDHRIALNLINLGTQLIKAGDNARALKNLERSLEILKSKQDSVNIGSALNSIGDIYFSEHQYEQASLHYKKAYEWCIKLKAAYYLPFFALNLGKSYHMLQQYDSAFKYLEESQRQFAVFRNANGLVDGYTWLAEASKSKGELSKALSYFNLSLAWKDTLVQEKTSKWMSELQMRYEFGKKEKEYELLQLKASTERRIWLGVVIGSIIIALLVFVVFRIRHINLQQRNLILSKERDLNKITLEKSRIEHEQVERDNEAKRKLAELEHLQLRQELMFKNQKLAATALHQLNKNETFVAIRKMLDLIDFDQPEEAKKLVKRVRKVINGNDHQDQDWEAFVIHFEEVHPGFFSTLQQAYPMLSVNDLRMCAYLHIGLNPKEIAQVLHVSNDSIRKKKQRLREKLNMNKDDDLSMLFSGLFKAQEGLNGVRHG
jgi:tetratricopeptide (TPR) repeat protein